MGLVATNRGTGSNNTAATFISASFQTNFNAGSFAVLCVAYDNAGSGGSDPFVSISDTKNNTWTSSINRLNDPGAASAGSTLRIFLSSQGTGILTTSDRVRINFGSVSVTAKAWTFTEISSSLSGYFPTFNIASGSALTTATPSITSTSIPSASLILGAVGREANGTKAGDADTTNGSWSTAQATGSGATTSGHEIITQFKIVNANGTQTFNPTFGGASADGTIAWIRVDENALGGTYYIRWIEEDDF